MVDAPSKDVADILDQMTARLRNDPQFVAAQARSTGLSLYASPEVTGDSPAFGELDLHREDGAITITAQTRNADAHSVHVTLADLTLTIGLGEGERACKQDVRLPAPVDEEHAVATFRNGVLDIVLPLRRSGK